MSEEPFGTTPIPTSLGPNKVPLTVTLDLLAPATALNIAQQPQTQQIAVYESKPNEDCINGSLLDVNQHFVVYAVKNGLIRVLHRHSAMRTLLRGHQGQTITDISFFLDGDVLGTVGSSPTDGSSTLIVWRVFEQSPEIKSEKLLEIPSPAGSDGLGHPKLSRLLWHPFNPNQLWMFHTLSSSNHKQVATLVETTRIQSTMHPTESHAVCQWHTPDCVMEDAVQLNAPDIPGSLTDLAWSGRDTRHVLTVHDNGSIVLWDLKQTEHGGGANTGTTTPKRLAMVQDTTAPALSRCLFMPHENAVTKQGQADTLTTCFVTASEQNSVITLWSSFTATEVPTKMQVLRLANPSSSYILDLCFGPAPQDASPPSCFLLWADRHEGKLLAVHVASQWNANQKALCVGSDYVVPFVLKHPVYSWSVVCSPTQDISEEDIQEHQGLIFDMKLFGYQSKVVQCLTLTSYMCLPPDHAYDGATPTSGVTVQALDLPSSLEPEYDEEYDVDDEEDDEEPEAPEASALPPPDDSGGGMSNPFANWLGAIATSTSTSKSTNIANIDLPPLPPAPAARPPGLAMPPGLVAAVGMDNTARSTSAVSTSSSQLLNPMDLLAANSSSNNTNNMSNGKSKVARSTTPSKPATTTAATNNKSKATKNSKSRSKSPKSRKSKNQSNSSPFPDGAKISILKRETGTGPQPPMPPPPPQPSAVNIVPADLVVLAVPPPSNSVVVPSPPAPPGISAAALEATLTKVVSKELAKQDDVAKLVEQAMADTLLPAVDKVVKESLASFGRPLQASMNKLGQQGVNVKEQDLKAALDVETPLKAALANTMRTVFVPAFESMTAQVLQQAAQPSAALAEANDQQTKALVALTQQLAAMNSKMDAMSNELQGLKQVVAESGRGGGGAPSSMPVPPQQKQQQRQQPTNAQRIEAIRNEITILLQRQQYEAAFTKALSATTPDMAVYCCSRADLSAVLGGNTPTLSQPILLCLMQQLGAALVSTTQHSPHLQTELQWLQEIALTLDTASPDIQRHVPTILQQLVASINSKIAENNPQLRRPLHMLLQVIRGMQMG